MCNKDNLVQTNREKMINENPDIYFFSISPYQVVLIAHNYGIQVQISKKNFLNKLT